MMQANDSLADRVLRKLKSLVELTHFRRRVGMVLGSTNPSAFVADFKTQYWQNDGAASQFMARTKGEEFASAAIMDGVVNRMFVENCAPGEKVLDIGCGHGIISILLATAGCRVTACDISQPLLDDLLQRKGELNIEVRRGEAHKIPAKDGEFDVAVARMFLGHFPDWPEIIGEIARCCRQGGRLVLHFTSAENAEFAQRFGKVDCDCGTSADLGALKVNPFTYFAEASEAEIRSTCHRFGLRMVERAPNMFFLHNRLIGRSLGTRRYQEYEKTATEYLGDPKVREFVIWFENTVVRHMPVWASYYNVLVLEKL